jgi:citrate synthase
MNWDRDHLTAAEAARALGVTRATLYAYVSRGLIRSERGSGRARRYDSSDVAGLQQGARAARPVLDTAITLARDGRLYYRGRDATEIARDLSVREAAALIWQADPAASFAADNLPDPIEHGAVLGSVPPAARALALLQIATAAEPVRADTNADFFAYAGARLLRFLTAAVAGVAPSARPIEAVLAEAWGLGREQRPLLRAALNLAAEGGIDAASHAARSAATSGMPIWRAVGIGLAMLRLDTATGAVALFAGKDPRGGFLVAALAGPAGRISTAPPLEAALMLLESRLGLPAGAAASLLLLGRSIGLVAHIAEALAAPRQPLPRGCYSGPPPPENP